MKCLSCGKNFDYEKYYGICPKCGTYNKQASEATSFTREEEENESYINNQEQPVYTNDNDYGSSYQHSMSKDEKKKRVRKNLTIWIIILATLSIVLSIVQSIVAGYLGTSDYREKKRKDIEEVAIEKVDFGEAYTVEQEYGRTLTVAKAEVLAEADTIGGFPAGQRLIAVRIESNEVDGISYDTYTHAPVKDFYISYDGTYRSTAPNYKLTSGGYDDIIGNRQSIDSYEFSDAGSHTGYLFFFIPADAQKIAFVYSVVDTESCDLIKYVKVPLEIDMQRDEAEAQSAEETITTLPAKEDAAEKPVVD